MKIKKISTKKRSYEFHKSPKYLKNPSTVIKKIVSQTQKAKIIVKSIVSVCTSNWDSDVRKMQMIINAMNIRLSLTIVKMLISPKKWESQSKWEKKISANRIVYLDRTKVFNPFSEFSSSSNKIFGRIAKTSGIKQNSQISKIHICFRSRKRLRKSHLFFYFLLTNFSLIAKIK